MLFVQIIQCFCCVLFCYVLCVTGTFKQFDDTILYRPVWPGPFQERVNQLHVSGDLDPDKIVLISTPDNEKYHCIIPEVPEKKDDEKDNVGHTSYEGKTLAEMMEELIIANACSYRLEQYWTYELCHGLYLRQYHEEKEDGKKTHLQEYILGRFSDKKYKDLFPEMEKPKSRKILKAETKYLFMNMTDGTKCDLTDKLRTTLVYYICKEKGRNEIAHFKETSTCEYEVVIATSFLCEHPYFRKAKDPVHEIECLAMENSPVIPKSLKLQNEMAAKSTSQYNKQTSLPRMHGKSQVVEVAPQIHTIPTDQDLIRNFLSGAHCLTGGRGWWKYEFCYGKHVYQFHQDKNQDRTNILLGTWNMESHVNWLDAFPQKKIVSGTKPKYVSHYFSSGDICDISGKARAVEVKLKCKDTVSQSPDYVSLYLLEPRPCEYILGVESPIICPLLEKADNYGIFPIDSEE
ncbi:PREDICTED: endoplasmic reticulum lectin 1-like [Priapulus caudatus]|uniref:Endoplasmic reticulum lectin 1 n=1 Tax=Priapulus caudatus TaxID=37621 RepID=A0ABM1DZB4_PRICU|nr:PREDICTED: endoplasmic reticulum lectin 1-like [Priapulus caudatus]